MYHNIFLAFHSIFAYIQEKVKGVINECKLHRKFFQPYLYGNEDAQC